MNIAATSSPPGSRLVLLLVLSALAAACGDADATEDGQQLDDAKPASSTDAKSSVCSDCVQWKPGGETTDFGSTSACTEAYLERELGRAEAEQLGFPLAAYQQRVEQPIDAALTWSAQRTDGGGPARGFQPETRVRGALEVRSFTYRWLDPERCDGTSCLLDDGTRTEQTCDDRYLFVNVSGELETLDGAIDVTFAKQPVNLRRPGQSDDFVVAAQANLRDVRGSLELDPAIPEPRKGVLDLSLQFPDDESEGYAVIDISVYPDWDDLPEDHPQIPSELSRYSPLTGRWTP